MSDPRRHVVGPVIMPAIMVALVAALGGTVAQAQFEDQSVSAFRAADTDGDELLTLDEFRTFIHHMADYGAPMSQRIRTFGAYRIAFGRVDANGDGVATPEELRAADRANR